MQGRSENTAPQYRTYSAPKPKLSWSEFLTSALYWLFPPTLFWGLTKYLINWKYGESVAQSIMPALAPGMKFIQQSNATERYRTFHESIHSSVCSFERLRVNTWDRAVLDTYELRWRDPSESEKTAKTPLAVSGADSDEDSVSSLDSEEPLISQRTNTRKHIIHFVDGNISCEQMFDQMEDDAAELGVNVIAFNYRGVTYSTGKPGKLKHLVTDGIAQVQRLLSNGVAPEKIILKGHGLGAVVATEVTRHFHDRKKKINIFSASSPSSLTNVQVGKIRTGYATGLQISSNPRHINTGHHETLGRKILGWLAKPFIKLKLCLTGWEAHTDSSWLSIPDANKEYMVVRTPKVRRTRARRDDPEVTHYASLHAALKPQRRLVKEGLQQTRAQICAASVGAGVAHEDLRSALQSVTAARERLKERKMEPDEDNTNGHTASPDDLHSRATGMSAGTFFQQFVERISDNQAKAGLRRSKGIISLC